MATLERSLPRVMRRVLSLLTVSLLLLCVAIHRAHGAHHTGKFVFVVVDGDGMEPGVVQGLTSDLTSQAKQLDVLCVVHVATDEWSGIGSWTYFPIVERLARLHGENMSWVVIMGKHVKVRLARLLQVLHTQNHSQPVFLGRGLLDREETIIHHFAHVDPQRPFLYPDVRTGVVLSSALVNRLAKDEVKQLFTLPTINIDAAYEFASYVKAAGIKLTSETAFCVQDGDHCAILFSPAGNCGKNLDLDRIHFAIKSCEQYHAERLPVLQDTWLRHASSYSIYSEVEDPVYGTVSLGVDNTKSGHCGKTLAIIRRTAHLQGMHWLVITDDDTLLSVDSVRELLACHDHTGLVALGERYGYRVASAKGYGYNYITGGGGMVFSQPLVEVLARPGMCECPSDDTPDDMFLGHCLLSLGVPIIHSSAFHQARPMDYAAGRLQGERPVSFHKFWMVDPRQVYAQWLQSPPTPTHHQDEL